jgi:hypothetical protein
MTITQQYELSHASRASPHMARRYEYQETAITRQMPFFWFVARRIPTNPSGGITEVKDNASDEVAAQPTSQIAAATVACVVVPSSLSIPLLPPQTQSGTSALLPSLSALKML